MMEDLMISIAKLDVDSDQYDKRDKIGAAIMFKVHKERNQIVKKIERAREDSKVGRMMLEEKRSMERTEEDVADLVNTYCLINGITYEELTEVNRRRDLVMNRQVLTWVIRKYRKLGLKRIGEIVGGKDHATALHCLRQVSNAIQVNDPIIMAILNRTLDTLFRLGTIKSKELYLDPTFKTQNQ